MNMDILCFIQWTCGVPVTLTISCQVCRIANTEMTFVLSQVVPIVTKFDSK